ncbi:hypothetical protein C1645_836928 [Glomus cerebriforme]|uniref:Uncharacterized protein n=1 Tax=Glomus cerebriforme TaxID=658196 RepID=A0A397S9J3_9GLOM|nr:hypothetical protein C1645_836928 [Glomus cerebriforme]
MYKLGLFLRLSKILITSLLFFTLPTFPLYIAQNLRSIRPLDVLATSVQDTIRPLGDSSSE